MTIMKSRNVNLALLALGFVYSANVVYDYQETRLSWDCEEQSRSLASSTKIELPKVTKENAEKELQQINIEFVQLNEIRVSSKDVLKSEDLQKLRTLKAELINNRAQLKARINNLAEYIISDEVQQLTDQSIKDKYLKMNTQLAKIASDGQKVKKDEDKVIQEVQDKITALESKENAKTAQALKAKVIAKAEKKLAAIMANGEESVIPAQTAPIQETTVVAAQVSTDSIETDGVCQLKRGLAKVKSNVDKLVSKQNDLLAELKKITDAADKKNKKEDKEETKEERKERLKEEREERRKERKERYAYMNDYFQDYMMPPTDFFNLGRNRGPALPSAGNPMGIDMNFNMLSMMAMQGRGPFDNAPNIYYAPNYSQNYSARPSFDGSQNFHGGMTPPFVPRGHRNSGDGSSAFYSF
jgi:hypothetical protein